MLIEIYTKAECCLCDDAKAVLKQAAREVKFELIERDIEKDPALFERFRYDIPVVFIDGRKAFKHRLELSTLKARLERGDVA